VSLKTLAAWVSGIILSPNLSSDGAMFFLFLVAISLFIIFHAVLFVSR
jgi:hypothetical protein